jgi:hypothetical protein
MKFGSLLGSLAGSIGSKVLPIPGIDGGALGGFLGGLTGFKNGGVIPGKRGQPRVVLCNGGETVIPLNSRVTKGQKATIARNKRKGKGRK